MSLTELSPIDPQTLTQLSPLDEAMGLVRSLAITEALPPNCTQHGLGTGSMEFYDPPTTHLIATIKDLTDMLDYASEDIDRVLDGHLNL